MSNTPTMNEKALLLRDKVSPTADADRLMPEGKAVRSVASARTPASNGAKVVSNSGSSRAFEVVGIVVRPNVRAIGAMRTW